MSDKLLNKTVDTEAESDPEVEMGRRTFLRRAVMGGAAAVVAAASIKPAFAGSVITDEYGKFDGLKLSINSETLAATKTLVATDNMIQWLDPDGASRDVTLPAEASSDDLMFIVYNSGSVAAMNLVVKNDGAGLIGTLGPGQTGFFSCDGVNWRWESNFGGIYDGVALATTLTSLEGTPIGAVTPAAGTFAALVGASLENTPIGQSTPAAGGFTTGDFSSTVKVDDVLTAINDGSYGVAWDESANTYVRTGALAGVAVGSSPGNDLLPIQAAMRRCILDDNGVVQYYLEPTNSYNRLGYAPEVTGTDDVGTASKLSDVGVFILAASEYVGKYVHNTTDDTYAPITAKDSDDVLSIGADIMDITEEFEICTAGIAYGGDGQVMVEIPLFYHRYSYVGTTHTYDISLVPLEGFSVHPAFVKNGVIVPYAYPSAYEGSMYDASLGTMVVPANVPVAHTITSGDKLCSLSGEFPKTNETRDEFRIMSAMRGGGWRQAAYDLASAWQLLLLVEYASFQSQSMIGEGRTQLSGGTWVADSYIGQCGKSNLDGNATGNVEGNTNAAYMSYRGIENIYGNVWKWIDGININEHLVYVCNDDSDFQDDTEEGYTALDVILPATNNYQQTLFPTNRGFLPKTVGASTAQIGDYYYQSTGWRVVRLGGSAISGAGAGAFDMYADSASSHDYVGISGRLAF